MKKAQVTSGSSVAIFIFLFALFMVLYVLLLPPEEREALLNETSVEEGQEIISRTDLLLKTNPGNLKLVSSDKVLHEINSINLYLKNEPVSSDLVNSLYISKGLFSEDNRQLIFNIEDLENLDKVNLYFLVVEGNGNLII